MNKNIRIAKELIGLAKNLVAISMTEKDWKQYSNDYQEAFGTPPNKELYDVFQNSGRLKQSLKQKRRNYSNLREFLSKKKLIELLNKKMFCIVSAGRNSAELENPSLLNKMQLKSRYNSLKRFLETLDLPYYEIVGNYGGSQEISYLVDLTNDGEFLNNSAQVHTNLSKIRNFCSGEMKQDCIIEGIGNATVFQYSGHYIEQDQSNPTSDPYDKSPESGRSTVFTESPSNYRRRNPSVKDKTHSFSNNYDWENERPGTKY